MMVMAAVAAANLRGIKAIGFERVFHGRADRLQNVPRRAARRKLADGAGHGRFDLARRSARGDVAVPPVIVAAAGPFAAVPATLVESAAGSSIESTPPACVERYSSELLVPTLEIADISRPYARSSRVRAKRARADPGRNRSWQLAVESARCIGCGVASAVPDGTICNVLPRSTALSAERSSSAFPFAARAAIAWRAVS